MKASRVAVACICVALCTLPAALAQSREAAPPAPERAGKHPPATCFWEGPISTKRLTTRGFDGRNFNFPEESATYWLARFNLPEGATLELRGRHPYGRYMSLNAYSEGSPTDALSGHRDRAQGGAYQPVRSREPTRHAQARLRSHGPRPAASGRGRSPGAEHPLRPAGHHRRDRARLPRLRARPRARAERRHRPAPGAAAPRRRQHDQGRGGMRRDQRPESRDHDRHRSG